MSKNKKIILGSVDLTDVRDSYEWYTIVTNYNMEEKYVSDIMNAVQDTPFEALIAEYYIPIKYILTNPLNVIEDGDKPKIKKEKGCFASYVFIKCKLTEELWNLLRTTTGASVILTTGGIPIPNTEEEIAKIRETQVPMNFGLEKTIALLEQQWRQYVKIVPGYNDNHPELPPPCPIEQLTEWFKSTRKKQNKLLSKASKEQQIEALRSAAQYGNIEAQKQLFQLERSKKHTRTKLQSTNQHSLYQDLTDQSYSHIRKKFDPHTRKQLDWDNAKSKFQDKSKKGPAYSQPLPTRTNDYGMLYADNKQTEQKVMPYDVMVQETLIDIT